MFCNNPHKSLQCSRLSRHQIVLQNWYSTEKSEVTYYSVLDFSKTLHANVKDKDVMPVIMGLYIMFPF